MYVIYIYINLNIDGMSELINQVKIDHVNF